MTFEGLQTAVEQARKRLAKNPDFVAKLERLGRERALIYKTLVLTGLRKGELASLTIGQLDLDAATPFVELGAADEKNRRGSTIPLRSDLANDLRAWVADKVLTQQDATSNAPTVRFDVLVASTGKRGRRHDKGLQTQNGQDVTDIPPPNESSAFRLLLFAFSTAT